MANGDSAKTPAATTEISRRSEARYLFEQAAMARRAADVTSLPNVRLRELQSAATWTRLAEAAERRERFVSIETDQTDKRARRGPTPMKSR
ncbi:MAG: hypothetical protein JWP15_2209 [Alphaproteobacteria bacterium]|nr:hypothetical protein [Alphaproteobacteria bacterium]